MINEKEKQKEKKKRPALKKSFLANENVCHCFIVRTSKSPM